MNNNVWQALMYSAIAGLSTGIGSLIALFTKKTNKTFLSVSLGFSAGVMIYVSFAELLKNSEEMLAESFGQVKGTVFSVVSLFCGIVAVMLIESLLPESKKELSADDCDEEKKRRRLLRSGVFTALTIAVHNLPEGLATFVSALNDPKLAVPVVAAVAIHNIPEGIAVSTPVFFATGSRAKAFWYSFLSGLAEPLGAVIGYLLLLPILNETVFGVLYGAVAGIMLYIALAELLPSANEQSSEKLAVNIGLVAGMLVMAVSLILFL